MPVDALLDTLGCTGLHQDDKPDYTDNKCNVGGPCVSHYLPKSLVFLHPSFMMGCNCLLIGFAPYILNYMLHL